MKELVIGEISRINSIKYTDKAAVLFGGKKNTWSQFDRSVNRLANMLIGSGFRKGDRLAFLSQNSQEYLEWYFACAKAGVIVVPINYRLVENEISHLLGHSEPKGMIVSDDYFDVVESLKRRCPLSIYYGTGDCDRNWLVEIDKEVKKYPDNPPDENVEEDDAFCIIYTSGTTGAPKGAVSTHKNYILNALATINAQRIVSDDINLVVAPLYHAGALFHSFSYAMQGCSQVVMKRFDPRQLLEIVQNEQITSCLMIPTMLNFFLNDPNFNQFDTSSLKKIFYGGGPMPSALLERGFKQLQNV
ncbi:MAG: AMP-binding protein, partial [Desulfobacterales bacterium]|nr:AMP-binding protein [Desulfobacterales bacterium]